MLEDQDHWEISEATNGQEAITRAAELRPDVILIDLAMPVMDGLTAAREISKLLPEIPILMCTMHWSTQLEHEARKYGIHQVLSKTDAGAVLSSVRQLLSSRLSRASKPLDDPIPLTLPANPKLTPAGTPPSTSTISTETAPPKEVPKVRRCG